MEKRKPHYNLDGLKMLLLHDSTRIITRSGRKGAAMLGYFDDEVMVARVMRLEGREFYKSMTTHASAAFWQDVYRSHDGRVGIYIKLQRSLDGRGVIISFKPLDEEVV
jgi:motility quorum-sensing regulator/GCU-specific mRNA interferase toxin